MKILLVAYEYPPYSFGGVSTYNYELSRGLVENLDNVSLTIVAGKSQKPFLESKIHERIRILRVPVPEVPPRFYWFQLFNRELILKLIKKHDIIHVHGTLSSLILKDLKKVKKKIIVTIHSQPIDVGKNAIKGGIYSNSPKDIFLGIGTLTLRKELYKKDLMFSDIIVFVSKHLLTEYVSYYEKLRDLIIGKSHIIPVGINVDNIAKYRGRGKKQNMNVAYIGRLFYSKGITYAINAIYTLIKEYKINVTFHIFGTGPLKNRLEKYVRKHNLEKNVIFYGFVSRDILLQKLSKCNVLLFPSLYEACPTALLEANAMGIPAVSFDLIWSREFIINGVNGYLSPPFDVDGLASNVLRACKLNPKLCQEVVRRYNIKLVINKIVELYNLLQN